MPLFFVRIVVMLRWINIECKCMSSNNSLRMSKKLQIHTSAITVSIHWRRPLWAAASTLETAVPISSHEAAWAPSTGSKRRAIVFEKYCKSTLLVLIKLNYTRIKHIEIMITCWSIAMVLADRWTAIIKDLKLLSPAAAAASACKMTTLHWSCPLTCAVIFNSL